MLQHTQLDFSFIWAREDHWLFSITSSTSSIPGPQVQLLDNLFALGLTVSPWIIQALTKLNVA